MECGDGGGSKGARQRARFGYGQLFFHTLFCSFRRNSITKFTDTIAKLAVQKGHLLFNNFLLQSGKLDPEGVERLVKPTSPLFEIARVLVRLDHVARGIVNPDHGVM
jgi:hypothetical protein